MPIPATPMMSALNGVRVAARRRAGALPPAGRTRPWVRPGGQRPVAGGNGPERPGGSRRRRNALVGFRAWLL